MKLNRQGRIANRNRRQRQNFVKHDIIQIYISTSNAQQQTIARLTEAKKPRVAESGHRLRYSVCEPRALRDD